MQFSPDRYRLLIMVIVSIAVVFHLRPTLCIDDSCVATKATTKTLKTTESTAMKEEEKEVTTLEAAGNVAGSNVTEKAAGTKGRNTTKNEPPKRTENVPSTKESKATTGKAPETKALDTKGSSAIAENANTKKSNVTCSGTSWPPYELGNLFYLDGRWAGGLTDQERIAQIKKFRLENSLGGKYFLRSGGIRNNLTLFEMLIKETRYDRVHQNAMVVHLRLGDNMVKESFFKKNNFNDGIQAPMTREFYKDLLSNKTWHNSTVILIGNYCGGGWPVKPKHIGIGEKYVRDLTSFFESCGMQVDNQISSETSHNFSLVDRDVAFATGAGIYVCSGGTFSVLMGAVVNHNGGETFNCPIFPRHLINPSFQAKTANPSSLASR